MTIAPISCQNNFQAAAISAANSESKSLVISKKVKLCVMVPESHADLIREVMAKYGAGLMGNYSHCSFSTKGTGYFREIITKSGEAGQLKKMAEERIETIVSIEFVEELIKQIKAVHPYKEVQPDVLPMLSSML